MKVWLNPAGKAMLLQKKIDMARESTCLTDIFFPNEGRYGVYQGEFRRLKQPCLQDNDSVAWIKDGPWHGSRRELRCEKLRDGCLSTTLSSSDSTNVSRPLEVSKNDLTQGVPDAPPDERTVSCRCRPYATGRPPQISSEDSC